MAKPNILELTPAQQPQYVPPPDLGPTGPEPEYVEQRRNNQRVANEHSMTNQVGRFGLPIMVIDRTIVGGRRRRYWSDL